MPYNEENLGGRREIARHVEAHHFRLMDIAERKRQKQEKAYYPHKPKEQLWQKENELANVIRLGQVLEHVKKRIDNSEPKANECKPRLGDRYKREAKWTQDEHERNLRAHQKILQQIKQGQPMTKRKLNQNDPVANPVTLFREKGQTQDVYIHSLMKQLGIAETQGGQPPKLHPGRTQINWVRPVAALRANARRPDSAYQNYVKSQSDEKSLDWHQNIPRVDGDQQSDYDMLLDKVTGLIVKFCIFKQRDLTELFNQTMVENQHLDLAKLGTMFKQLLIDLEK